MLLIGDSCDSVDVYYYKLILATLCSKHGMAYEFEDLIQMPIGKLRSAYVAAHGAEEKSFVDLFRHYLGVTREWASAEVLINESYDKLFSMNIEDVVSDLFDSVHMDEKVRIMLGRSLDTDISPLAWQNLRSAVISHMKKAVKPTAKFVGEHSSLLGMTRSTIEFYVKKFRADLFEMLNKTGVNVVDENEFSIAMLSSETLGGAESYEINFPAVASAIYKLNKLMFEHTLQSCEVVFLYDLISYYKRAVMEEYIDRMNPIFDNFRIYGAHARVLERVRLDKEGMREKFDRYRLMLIELDPLVKSGLKPEEVDRYVSWIYKFVNDKSSAGAASLFTRRPVGENENGSYGTRTTFSKVDGHDAIRTVLEGLQALHHLLKYITSHGLNLFDLDLEVFTRPGSEYRFKTVEEAIDLFGYVKDLMDKPEDPALAARCFANALPPNDDVVASARVISGLERSIAFIDISGTLGDLSVDGQNRQEQREAKNRNLIYAKFHAAHARLAAEMTRLRNIKVPVKIGGDSLEQVSFHDFAIMLGMGNDILTATRIAGLTADKPCVKDLETGYWELPEKPFLHYCGGHESVVTLTGYLRKQDTDKPDSLLELYRCANFFSKVVLMMAMTGKALAEILERFGPETLIPMGFFDAYEFASKHQTAGTLASADSFEAVKLLADELNVELHITRKISRTDIYDQLLPVYKVLTGVFSGTLHMLEEIRDLYYTGFAGRLGGGYSLSGDEGFFGEANRVVMREKIMNMQEGFVRYASHCTRTIHGFLKDDGKLVSRVESGRVMFLNERGVWVGRQRDGQFVMTTADDSYFMGRR